MTELEKRKSRFIAVNHPGERRGKSFAALPRSLLPEAVVDAALDEDGELAVARNAFLVPGHHVDPEHEAQAESERTPPVPPATAAKAC